MLKPFLQCMLHCTHFLHWIVKLVLEHVYHDQLVHLDRHFSCSSNISNWLSRIPTQSILVIQNFLFFITILYYITPLVQVFCLQFSSLTIIYFILGVKSGSLTFLVPMSANCRPPSHQSILCILHFSPFLKKCILLAICLVCFVSLPSYPYTEKICYPR